MLNSRSIMPFMILNKALHTLCAYLYLYSIIDIPYLLELNVKPYVKYKHVCILAVYQVLERYQALSLVA